MAREIQILDSASSVAESGALHFVRICNSSIKANGKFSVVLSGGSTPKGMLSLLATDEYKNKCLGINAISSGVMNEACSQRMLIPILRWPQIPYFPMSR